MSKHEGRTKRGHSKQMHCEMKKTFLLSRQHVPGGGGNAPLPSPLSYKRLLFTQLDERYLVRPCCQGYSHMEEFPTSSAKQSTPHKRNTEEPKSGSKRRRLRQRGYSSDHGSSSDEEVEIREECLGNTFETSSVASSLDKQPLIAKRAMMSNLGRAPRFDQQSHTEDSASLQTPNTPVAERSIGRPATDGGSVRTRLSAPVEQPTRSSMNLEGISHTEFMIVLDKYYETVVADPTALAHENAELGDHFNVRYLASRIRLEWRRGEVIPRENIEAAYATALNTLFFLSTQVKKRELMHQRLPCHPIEARDALLKMARVQRHAMEMLLCQSNMTTLLASQDLGSWNPEQRYGENFEDLLELSSAPDNAAAGEGTGNANGKKGRIENNVVLANAVRRFASERGYTRNDMMVYSQYIDRDGRPMGAYKKVCTLPELLYKVMSPDRGQFIYAVGLAAHREKVLAALNEVPDDRAFPVLRRDFNYLAFSDGMIRKTDMRFFPHGSIELKGRTPHHFIDQPFCLSNGINPLSLSIQELLDKHVPNFRTILDTQHFLGDPAAVQASKEALDNGFRGLQRQLEAMKQEGRMEAVTAIVNNYNIPFRLAHDALHEARSAFEALIEQCIAGDHVSVEDVVAVEESIVAEELKRAEAYKRLCQEYPQLFQPWECSYCKTQFAPDKLKALPAHWFLQRFYLYMDLRTRTWKPNHEPWTLHPLHLCPYKQEQGEALAAFIGRSHYKIGQRDSVCRAVWLYGVGGSGKTTILDIISWGYQNEDVGEIGNEVEAKWSIADVGDCQVALFPELKANCNFPMGKILVMIEGKHVKQEVKRQNAKKISWDAYIYGAMNELVGRWEDRQGELLRRFLYFIFEHAPPLMDDNLIDAIRMEYNCITALGLLAYRRLAGLMKLPHPKLNKERGWEGSAPYALMNNCVKLYMESNIIYRFLTNPNGDMEFGPHETHYMPMATFREMFNKFYRSIKPTSTPVLQESGLASLFRNFNIKLETSERLYPPPSPMQAYGNNGETGTERSTTKFMQWVVGVRKADSAT